MLASKFRAMLGFAMRLKVSVRTRGKHMNLERAKVLLTNSRLKRRSPTIPAALLNTVIRYVVRRFIIANVFTHRNLVRGTVLRRLSDRTLTKKTGA